MTLFHKGGIGPKGARGSKEGGKRGEKEERGKEKREKREKKEHLPWDCLGITDTSLSMFGPFLFVFIV